MKRRFLSKIVVGMALILASQITYAQHQGNEAPVLDMIPTESVMKIDGILDESIWQTAPVAKDFWQQNPQDNAPALQDIQVRFTFDDDFLYVGGRCVQNGNYVVPTLKRDSRIGDQESVFVNIDPVGKQSNGYFFSLNAAGVQSEGLLSSTSGVDPNWDCKWTGEVSRDDQAWYFEMAIPFRSLRFEDNQAEWKLNILRVDFHNNEAVIWKKVPLQFETYDLGYMGTIKWPKAPKRVESNISLIPYISGRANKNLNPSTSTDYEGDVGLEGKFAVTSSLNLDFAINPDFSQVEVDQQVINLSRFSVFFPEKRIFFLENNDVFGEFGNRSALPFFSRRLGLDENGFPLPIQYGLRLSGNVDDKTRIGVMNVQTRAADENPSQNNTAITFNKRVLDRSIIKGYVLNRQATDGLKFDSQDYGRNAGLEFNYVTKSGTWDALGGYHQSFRPEKTDKSYFVNGKLNYSGRNFRALTNFASVGANYYADMGFAPNLENYDAVRDTVIRLGFTRAVSLLDYFIIPENIDKITSHRFGFENIFTFNEGRGLTEYYNRTRYFISFKNRSAIKFRYNTNYIDLQFPFSFTGETPLPAQEYTNREFNIQANSNENKSLIAEGFVVYGSFYGGTKLTYWGDLEYRAQPWGNFSFNLQQNFLRFDDPYGDIDFTLIGSRIEVNFSRKLFWNNFIQYNTQSNNFNINSRLQWRYKPLSDFFLVYTDNYIIEPSLRARNRSLVFKLNYWLNL